MNSDCEIPRVYQHHERKAARDHLCCECRGRIAKGELYHAHSGIWDRLAYTFKRCADCESLACDLGNNSDDCGAPFGQLWDFIQDSGDARLIAAFKVVKEARRPQGAKS